MLPGLQSKVAGSIPPGGKLNLIVRTRLGITEVIQGVRYLGIDKDDKARAK
ncbi:hypothetical protein C2G38_2163753 [Gigaspora rosea]|uniref:Uncharacterized protein n=1 Tax=Gigaspora rosea TaxID=44941 RepID=A0A397VWU2_9GLOM|nr:hypothetical protein C2G38_2163753 [Gigaspora rosea]